MNYAVELRHVVSTVLKKIPKDRYEIAAKMSALLGVDVSKSQLDSWSCESKDGWRFPLEYFVAFEIACETYDLTLLLAKKRGFRAYFGDEIRQAEVGRLKFQIKEMSDKLKSLEKAKVLGQ
ncbi:MAG: hypothetical protein Q8K00_13140 [Syntrophales bacterium]|nr:hypothetical protein [Syntrophales bacterium]